jgi:osmotically-inducible protein OsmY
MARLFFTIAAVAVSIGCSAETATKERDAIPPSQAVAASPAAAPAARPATVAVPGNDADRGIRRHLTLAIAGDAELKNREISFIVANGDVSVMGIVGTEEERRKINALAMSIDGVKSVANALRVAEAE